MTSLNILMVHSSIYKKGGWGRIFPLAKGLVKNGHSVTILTSSPDFSFFTKRKAIDGIRIIIFPEVIPARFTRFGFGLLSLVSKIIHVLFNKYDVVHSDNGHRPLAGIPCRLHKKRFNSVYVAEWYDWWGRGGHYDKKSRVFKFIFGWYENKYEIKDKMIADGVVVLSDVLKSRAEQFKRIEQIRKIHGGADISAISFLQNNDALKSKLGIDKEVLTLGYISAMGYNLPELLPVINTLIEYKLFSKIKILVFGDYSALINELPKQVQDTCIFFGWVDYKNDLEKLQCVDVFFLFKDDTLINRAGWPNCLGDYLAFGRPVMINPVGEAVDFVNRFPVAFFKTSANPKDINTAIENIFENTNEIELNRPKIRRIAEEEISWENKSIDLLDFYKYLITAKA